MHTLLFKKLLVLVETKKGLKVKGLCSENGCEYTSHECGVFCTSRGIQREFTTPYTRVHDGMADRMNRTIQDRVVVMLDHAKLS